MAWFLGVLISTLGCTSLSVGLNVEKLSLVKNEALPPEKHRVCYHQPLWLFGFALFILGNVLNFIALSYASSTLLAPISSVSICVNAVASTLLLNETFSKTDLYCLVYIISGATLAVVFSSHESPESEISMLAGYLLRPPFLVVVAFCLTSGAASFTFLRDTPSSKETPSALLPFAFSYTSALFGSLSFLSSKIVSMLLSSGNFNYYIVFPALFFLLLGALSQIKFMNKGLTVCEAMVVLPSYYSFSIILQMITGGVFFDEFSSFGKHQVVGFCAGVFLTLFGVYQLSLRSVGVDAESRTQRAATLVLGEAKTDNSHLKDVYRRHSLIAIPADLQIPGALHRRFSYHPTAYNAFPSPQKSGIIVPDGVIGDRRGSVTRQRTFSVAIVGLGVS